MEREFTREDYIKKEETLKRIIVKDIVKNVSLRVETLADTKCFITQGTDCIDSAIEELEKKYPFLSFTKLDSQNITWKLKGE